MGLSLLDARSVTKMSARWACENFADQQLYFSKNYKICNAAVTLHVSFLSPSGATLYANDLPFGKYIASKGGSPSPIGAPFWYKRPEL